MTSSLVFGIRSMLLPDEPVEINRFISTPIPDYGSELMNHLKGQNGTRSLVGQGYRHKFDVLLPVRYLLGYDPKYLYDL